MAPPLHRQLVSGAGFGAAVGLSLFALEAFWLWTGNVAGIQVEQKGPFAALFAVILELLPPLVVRVAVAYVIAGAALGVVAAVLARAWSPKGGRVHRALWAGGFFGLLAASVLGHAVERPALFDDLPRFRPILGLAVTTGEPWHAQVLAAGIFLSAVVALALQGRIGGRRPVAAGTAVAGLVLLFLVPLASPRASAKAGPRVVVIGIDAFRPDRLTALGARRQVAPTLDAFAGEATIFTTAYTPIAQTEPAWRSMLTARWPPSNGVRYPLTADKRELPLPTFASVARDAGVRTIFATDCSRFHFETERSGFEERWQPPRGALNFALEKLRFRGVGLFYANAFGAWLLPEFVDNRALAGIHDPQGYAGRLARGMVKELAAGPALFAWHSTAAHFPGDPSYPHYRKFVAPDRPLERRLRMQFAPIGAGDDTRDPHWGREESEALYDELLAQSDAQVGVLFEALKANRLWDDTTVIVFSDHGESFHGDVPRLEGATPVHGARLTEEENRILLMVKPARGQGGPERKAVVDALVRLVDVGPTVLEALGSPVVPEADGKSLLPLVRGESEPPRLLYAETGYTHASPAAFDPGHLAVAPRTFDAYSVRPDGVVEMTDWAHAVALSEKDRGAFDGQHWLILSPRADNTLRETCTGNCEVLQEFLKPLVLRDQ